MFLLNVRQLMSNYEIELGAAQPVDTNICHSDESRPTVGIHQFPSPSRVYKDANQMDAHLFRQCEGTLVQIARLDKLRFQSFRRQESCLRETVKKARTADPKNSNEASVT